MADIALAADAAAVANVKTATLDTYDAASTYKVTINGKTISTVGTGGTTSTTATALRALLNASTAPPEFLEITWSGATNAIIGTSDTAGKPITPALTVTGGTGTVTDFASTTANDGPEALSANNCKDASSSARGLPVNSDTFTIESLDSDLKYGLDSLSAVTLAALYIEASMTGEVALHPVDEDGATNYDQYRPLYLACGATLCTIGGGTGDGCPLCLIDFGSVQTTCTVRKTGTAALDGLHACVLKGTHASNVLRVESGTVDVAPFAGEFATLATLSVTGDAEVRTSIGVTLGTINADGQATLEIDQPASLTDVTAINLRDSATVTVYGSNPIGTVTLDGEGPTLAYNGSGTVTAANLYSGATLDLTNNLVGATFTTISIFGPCAIKDPNGKLTVTNAITNWSQVTAELSPKRAVTLGSP